MCMHAPSCQSCLTPYDSMGCNPPGFSDSPGRNTGVGCHALLQGIFSTQESNPHLLCLLYCRQILYRWATGEAQRRWPCLPETIILFMIFLFQPLSALKTLSFFVALWWSFLFARGGAAWFMNDLDLHIHSVELSFNNTWSKKKKTLYLIQMMLAKLRWVGWQKWKWGLGWVTEVLNMCLVKWENKWKSQLHFGGWGNSNCNDKFQGMEYWGSQRKHFLH